MVRRPSPALAKLLESYVPVRVLDMRGVDLSQWTFDYDLTFAAVIASPSGEVLHRYGARDERAADHWLNEASFAQFLKAGLQPTERGDVVRQAGGGDEDASPFALEDVPAFAKRDRGECIHCHSVRPALRIEAQERETWKRSDLWAYPPPHKIGLDLDQLDQQLITKVVKGSAAQRAGLREGDRLLRVGDVPIVTATDLMAALDGELPGPVELTCEFERNESEPRTVTLSLADGWKAYTPAEFAWRPSKWGLAPAPGFGGPVLQAEELKKAGLEPDTFAFRINYLVTWGENQRFGVAAAKAGLRDGMLVLGTTEKRDFESLDHFHAWWRLTVALGSSVSVVVHGREEPIVVPVGPR